MAPQAVHEYVQARPFRPFRLHMASGRTFDVGPLNAADARMRAGRGSEGRGIMTTLQIPDHIVAEPFRPFRIHTTGGRTFEVRNPEAAGIGRTSLVLSVSLSDDIPDAKGPWYDIPLSTVEAIETMETPRSTEHERARRNPHE